MTLELTVEDVEAARRTIGTRLHRTPVLSSLTLGERIGATVLLKAELFQRTGSFKPRGVLTKLASLDAEERARGVISISAGNHAQALAYGAARERIDCLVVMWQGADPVKLRATRGYGAEVDLAASGPAEAFERLHELIRSTGRTLVHPFDDRWTMAGQGTLALEVLDEVPHVDAIVVPVGGAGLVAGIATALKGRLPSARVVAVEPERSAALHQALDAGYPVPIEPKSIADGLNAPFVGGSCLAVCRRLLDETVLVTDEEIETAMRFLYERAKLACEPAGAAATGALLAGKVGLQSGETVVAVVSGGNVAPSIASGILSRNEGRNPS